MSIPEKKEAYLFRIILALALMLVFILTMMKPVNLPVVSVSDKFTHLFAFMILAFLADYAFSPARLKITKTLMLLSFGIIIEIAQYFTSWRTAEWQDAMADLVGILLYWLAAPLIVKFLFWRKKPIE